MQKGRSVRKWGRPLCMDSLGEQAGRAEGQQVRRRGEEGAISGEGSEEFLCPKEGRVEKREITQRKQALQRTNKIRMSTIQTQDPGDCCHTKVWWWGWGSWEGCYWFQFCPYKAIRREG